MVASGLTYGVHRRAFALSNLAYMFDSLLVDEQSHALLALVGDDFLGRQSLVTNRQFIHVNQSATLLNQL